MDYQTYQQWQQEQADEAQTRYQEKLDKHICIWCDSPHTVNSSDSVSSYTCDDCGCVTVTEW